MLLIIAVLTIGYLAESIYLYSNNVTPVRANAVVVLEAVIFGEISQAEIINTKISPRWTRDVQEMK